VGYYLLSAEATFSAAHTLAGVDLCERMHGHNWRVRVTVRVPESALDRAGMGLDFRVLAALAGESVGDFEHRYLNDLPDFQQQPPSAERIASVLARRAAARLRALAPAATLEEVEVWETPHYRVVFRPA
jgi:6-pyruvoyltetrahydropterin/6-carboxytetrahydropterin synthase